MSDFLKKNFKFDEKNNAFCQIFNEDKGRIRNQKINCAKNSNMRRHVDRNHKKEAQELKNLDELQSRKRKAEAEYDKNKWNAKRFSDDAEQSKITSFYPSTTLSIEISAEEFQQGMIEMVIFDGAPMEIFSGKGFQRISGEMAKKLGVPTSPDSVRGMIIKFAEEKKKELQRILTKKLVYIQVDACTRHQRNFLGINVQFEEKEKIITKTLGVVDTQGKHTASDIKKIVHQNLEKFDISVENVLSVSVDNAKNMIKMANELKTNENAAESMEDSDDDHDSCDVDDEGTEEGWHLVNEPSKSLVVMRCVIHTLQLALADGLKSRYSSNFLAQIRNVVKKLRTVSVLATIRKKYSVIPIMDNETRWGSKYKMIKRLLVFKSFCEDLAAANSDYNLSPYVWEELKNLADLLAKPYAVTIRLQKQDITPGEFMKQWCNLKYDFEKNGGKIAMDILESMKDREKKLMENHLLLAAIYVDPRYRILLPAPVEENKEKAKAALKRVALQLLELKNEGIEQLTEIQAPANEESLDLHGDTDESDDEYEKVLDKQEKSQRITQVQVTGFNTQVNLFIQ